MRHKLQFLFHRLKPLIKPVMAIALMGVLMFGHADGALAARAGGRIGGGSFRAPTRVAPSPSYRSPGGGGGYYPGGGFGFPFLLPLFGFGGGFGGLFSIILFIGLANFIMRTVREMGSDNEAGGGSAVNPPVSVAKLQIGLLAEARSLQDDLNRIALSADTSSSEGLTQVLQEATLSLLRHPEYWQYATAQTASTRLLSAEQNFNQLVLAERSKFTGETVSNVNNRLQQADAKVAESGELAPTQPGAYIVASVIVATQGKLNLPKVSSTQDVRQALSTLGAVSSDRLLAVEVLWTPQASGETLTSDEMIAEYPELTLV